LQRVRLFFFYYCLFVSGANLLLDANGRIKVADFGACTYAELDKRLTVIGTPFWMAPEIIEMTSGGTAADIWSLGCTVVELLTGSPPYYTLGSMQALFRMVDDPHPPLPANVSPQCSDFLLKCFVKARDRG
jgi:serine/threonine protein kinase